jgi:hypothetical protein
MLLDKFQNFGRSARNGEKDQNRDITVLILLFIVGLALRMARLFDLDIWFDEAVLLFQLDGSLADIWNYCKNDNFPPLYPWLIKIWHSVFPGENSLRFFSALLGSLTPPVVYLLGKELSDRRLGIFLGIACCISVPFLYYSQMIRMYTLFPFFGCISLLALFRGMKTGSWKYWILMAVANVLGFYNFVYILFLIAAEFVVLIWYSRRNFKVLLRPVLTHIPAGLLILLWLVPLLHRYIQIQDAFWISPVSWKDLIKLWFFFGTGSDMGDRYLISVFLNIPFLLGFILGVKTLWYKKNLRISMLIVIGIIIGVYALSHFGQSIFFKRYFFFLVPLYLAVVFAAWLEMKKKLLRWAGLGLTWLALLITIVYYYGNYCEVHQEYVFTRPRAPDTKCDPHGISRAADFLEDRLGENEIIVHFSAPFQGSFSYFPMLFYHQRRLPEYLFSVNEIPDYFGGQYIKPGERIGSLDDFETLPSGIWIVSLDSVYSYFDIDFSKFTGRREIWIERENLLEELAQLGYEHLETKRYGRVSNRYYTREPELATQDRGIEN